MFPPLPRLSQTIFYFLSRTAVNPSSGVIIHRITKAPHVSWIDIIVNDEINYKNSPLHGLSLKKLLAEIVDHYGFEILFAYLNINCFKTNPSLESSLKFLAKTQWAREKVEAFYLYTFKNLPKACDEQFQLSPRDRIVPEGQEPREPAKLSLEDAERLREKRVKKSSSYNTTANKKSLSQKSGQYARGKNSHRQKPAFSPNAAMNTDADPWAQAKQKILDKNK